MGFTLIGLLLLSSAPTYHAILLAVGMVGIGSSVFHPESSRVARMASGGQHGLAQSLFQVGGNFGTSLGPLLAAFIVLPEGQRSIAWFSAAALIAIVVLTRVGVWYKRHRHTKGKSHPRAAGVDGHPSSRRIVHGAGGAVLPDAFQIRLHGEPEQLLHLLPDRAGSTYRCRTRRFICSCFWARWRREP